MSEKGRRRKRGWSEREREKLRGGEARVSLCLQVLERAPSPNGRLWSSSSQ